MPTGGGGGGAVAATPLAYAEYPSIGGSISLGGANQVAISGFNLPYTLTFSHIGVFVGAADAVGNYDLGIYSQGGTLIANIGAQHLPSTSSQSFATVQGAKTINPGLYIFGFTGTATTGGLTQQTNNTGWVFNINVAVSAGGALPASIAAQSVTPGRGPFYFILF